LSKLREKASCDGEALGKTPGSRPGPTKVWLAAAAATALWQPLLAAAVEPSADVASTAAVPDKSAATAGTPGTDEAGAKPTAAGPSMGTTAEAEAPLPSAPPRESAETNDKSMSSDAAPELETAGHTELYGPPVPKVERGRLSEIEWPDAPKGVPAALENAIGIVTKNYPSAKAARSALRAAAQDLKAAKWQWFPTLTGDLAYLDDSHNPEPQLTVEQPIWSGGRIDAGIRRARAAEDATSADYVATIEQLAFTVAQTYFQIAQLTRRERLLADSMYEHLSLVQTMQHRVDQEVSPLADLELARSRAAQIEQEFTTTRSQRQTALRVLAELVADPSFDLGPVPAYDPSLTIENAAGLEDQAVSFDPQLRGLKAETDVARADYDARKASILPQVNAQYSYDRVFKSRVGVVLRAQTTGGLSQISQVNSARLRIDSSLEASYQAEQRLRRDIASDIIEFESQKERASISTRASETAAQVSESYKRQFIAGRRSWLDVMNALRETVNAQISQSDAQVAAQAARVRLLLRSGRWRPNFDSPGQKEADERRNQALKMGQM
jgi:adhesin transport system outer membrane protein